MRSRLPTEHRVLQAELLAQLGGGRSLTRLFCRDTPFLPGIRPILPLLTLAWGYETWIYAACAVWFFDKLFRFGRALKAGFLHSRVVD